MITTKIYTIFKYITIISILIISIIACETDFENVGGELVNNGVFNTKKQSIEILSYTKNLEKSRVDNINTSGVTSLRMPLGIMDNEDFGMLKSQVVAQIIPPSNIEWGESFNLDAVYLEIPYDSKSIRKDTDTIPKFELNNIYGDKDIIYKIKVSRLDTYLNSLDPSDPSQSNKYYSDKVYNITSDVLYPLTDFKPIENDTVEYFDRTLLSSSYNFEEIQVQDTIKYTEAKPFIRFKLNKTFFEDNFTNEDQRVFLEDRTDFLNHFKGIVIDAEGTDGSVMMLDFSLAKINLYYTNLEDKVADEVEPVDLNNDGDYVDEGETEGVHLNDDDDYTDLQVTISVRTKKTLTFPLIGIKTNHFERDYSSALGLTQITSPNTVEGEQKLYVQGAAGSIAILDLFNGVDLDELRAKNWLINEASLTFNIDNENNNNVPNRLLLYKLDPDEINDINENVQVLDAITQGDFFNGFLQVDDSESKNPTKYKVNITDYISEILKKEDFKTPSKLGLKVYNVLDSPVSPQDTIVKDYSWNPQGVVLYGNNFIESDTDYDKRVKLEIYYTELNN